MALRRATDDMRRVLVVLEAGREGLHMLEEAAEIAGGLGAALDALFIEDEAVLGLAEAPAVRLLGLSGVAVREAPDARRFEREFRARAEEARRALARAALARKLAWSFEVARGRPAETLARMAGHQDLVALPKSARRGPLGRRLSEMAQAMAARGPGAVLFAEGRLMGGRRISVVYDGSPCAMRALAIARRLAAARGGRLEVLLPAPPEPGLADRLQASAAERLHGAKNLALRYRPLPAGDAAALRAQLESGESALLVLGADCLPFAPRELERLLAETDQPVLLVRTADEPAGASP